MLFRQQGCPQRGQQRRQSNPVVSAAVQLVVSHPPHPYSPAGRRTIIGLGSTALLLGLLPKPASSAIVDEEAAFRVFDAAAQSTVSVVVFKTLGGTEVQQGVGSGFLWDQFGHVVTNYHVVANTDKKNRQAVKVSYKAADGRTVMIVASIVSMDALRDVAVLQARAPLEGLTPIRVGQSSTLKVGQSVFALGYPYGLSQTLSTGVVSGLDRAIPSAVGTKIYGAIQMDAQVNQGNSGGPLLDSFGRLVGMNTATFTRAGTGRGSGVNFALPVDMLMEVVPKMAVYGSASGKRV